MPLVELIPNGLCRCGCGEPVYRRKYVANRRGKPNYKQITCEFRKGHNQRVDGRHGYLPTDGTNWAKRKDAINPAPILKLVEDRRRRYNTSMAAMERTTGVRSLHNIRDYKYILKSTAERILLGLKEHYPYIPYVPNEGEMPVEPKTSGFNYITAKPTNIQFSPNDPDWNKHAACKGKPLSMFFPDGGPTPHVTSPLGKVRAICAKCPVADDCFGTALSFGEEHGIWGGVWLGNKAERELSHATYKETGSMAKTRAKVVKFARLSYADRKK